jgi:integrase
MGKRSTVYNNIVGDKYELVNEDNQELLEEWKEYMTSVDRSQKTIRGYESDYKIWAVFCYENCKDKYFVDITKRDIIKFQNYCLKLGHSPSRVRRLRSTLSSLSNYIENILDDEYPDFRNIINKIEAPSLTTVREKLVLSMDQFEELLGKLVEDKHYQEACALALAGFSGARKSELYRFKVSYFDDKNIKNGLYENPEKIKTKGRGNNGKMLTKWTIRKYFEPYLKLWIEQREIDNINSEWLFVTKDSNRDYIQAKVSTLNSWADTISKYLGERYYFHSSRHLFVTNLVRAQIPSQIIKEIVGWNGIELISTYSDIEASEEFSKYFSDEGIKESTEGSINNL